MSNSKIALFIQSTDICRLGAIQKCINIGFPLPWCTSEFRVAGIKYITYHILSSLAIVCLGLFYLFWLQVKKALSTHHPYAEKSKQLQNMSK